MHLKYRLVNAECKKSLHTERQFPDIAVVCWIALLICITFMTLVNPHLPISVSGWNITGRGIR